MAVDRVKKRRLLNPSLILVLGFGFLILMGTILLNLPIASKTGESIGFINALFTASSSVCVTGLVVVNTANHWTTFGHVIIILLIQIGALGFMTMATVIALFLGKRISLRERLVIKEQLNQESMSGLVRLTKYVIIATLTIEAIGAIFLSMKFIPTYGIKKGIWFSVFHAISAFCNAGFDLLGDSLVSYSGDWIVNLTITSLVILGGLGFGVYIDIKNKKSFKKLQLHSKLVITISVILLLVGSIGFFVLEYNNLGTIKDLSLSEKGLISYFQSVVARTAGFITVDLNFIHESTAFFLIILMFIGGSPGSTGGGIKTTTFGILALTTLSVIKGNKDVEIFKKRIATDIIHRALAIVSISFLVIIMVSLILTITEDVRFIDILFESTSAFATVGVSRGITGNLSNIGKLIISLTMYIGRVGPLTMGLAFASRSSSKNYRYSEGNILVG